MATFGEGLGGVIGGVMAKDDLSDASMTIRGRTDDVMSGTKPYGDFGAGLLAPASDVLTGSASGDVGMNRLLGKGNDVTSYNDFMKDYKTSDAAKYTMGQATNALENSASAHEGLLSGANLRAVNQTTQDISSTYANKAYEEYLAGNNQQFGQLETSLGNLFQGIGVGQTATGQNVSAVSSENGAQASIANSTAKADAGLGSGIGSMFSGLAGLATK